MKLLESSPGVRIFSSARSGSLKTDDDRFEPSIGSPPRRLVRRRTDRSSSLFDPLRIDREASWLILNPLLRRQQREASRGPGGGNEPPGRRHDAGEIRHGGPRPQPFASSPQSRGAPAADQRMSATIPPMKTTRLSHIKLTLCSRVEASRVPTRSRERSPCVPVLRHPPPGLRPSLTGSSGWRLRGESEPLGPAQPSIRVDQISDRSPLTAFVNRRLEARTGKASPSDPRPPRGEPGTVFGRPLQPCLLVIPWPDQRRSPVSEGTRTPSIRSDSRRDPLTAARAPELRSSRTPPLPPAPRRSPGTSTTPPTASAPRPRSPPCAAACSPPRTAADTTDSARCRAGTCSQPQASSIIIHRTRRLPALLIPCSRRHLPAVVRRRRQAGQARQLAAVADPPPAEEFPHQQPRRVLADPLELQQQPHLLPLGRRRGRGSAASAGPPGRGSAARRVASARTPGAGAAAARPARRCRPTGGARPAARGTRRRWRRSGPIPASSPLIRLVCSVRWAFSAISSRCSWRRSSSAAVARGPRPRASSRRDASG